MLTQIYINANKISTHSTYTNKFREIWIEEHIPRQNAYASITVVTRKYVMDLDAWRLLEIGEYYVCANLSPRT